LLFVANDTAKRLLARIRQLREARGLTQEAFAEQAGLTYKHYQQVESGLKPNFRIDTLFKLADGLGLEPWELLNFDLPLPAVDEDPGKGTRKATKRR
jgi:transcriptional regulator with XRE-family HTH domain